MTVHPAPRSSKAPTLNSARRLAVDARSGATDAAAAKEEEEGEALLLASTIDQAQGHASSQVPAGLSSLASSAYGHRRRGRTRESQWEESGEGEEEVKGGEEEDDVSSSAAAAAAAPGGQLPSSRSVVFFIGSPSSLAEAAKPLWCEEWQEEAKEKLLLLFRSKRRSKGAPLVELVDGRSPSPSLPGRHPDADAAPV